jgi:hypothetical protein
MNIVIKTSQDLKRFLLAEMVETADGKREPQAAKAICNYAQQLYNITNLELKYANAKSKLGEQIKPVDFSE